MASNGAIRFTKTVLDIGTLDDDGRILMIWQLPILTTRYAFHDDLYNYHST
jgi:hypothetical protein